MTHVPLRVEPLDGAITGVAVHGLDLAAPPHAGSAEWQELAAAFTQHGMLLVRTARGGSATPAQVQAFYTSMHAALGLREVPSHRKAGVGSSGGRGELSDNLRGAAFPEALGTNVLGNVPEGLDGWHGLTGLLQPASWWERESVQYHHDGSFSAPALVSAAEEEHDGAMTTVRDAPPMLLQMYCVDAPPEGGGELGGGRVVYKAGATLLLSTTHAFAAAPSAVAERARRMTAVYTKGFGNVAEGEYPRMAPSGLRPLAPAAPDTVSADARYAYSTGQPVMVHPLVLDHPDTGRPYVFVHTVCLDHLEEDGVGALSWDESMEFLDSILDPALGDTIVVNWEPGDLCFWDNRTMLHSVSPTAVYEERWPGRRLMMRTAMAEQGFSPFTTVQGGTAGEAAEQARL
jgi:alpha-ketoglutarate-dependent taurine dioxygenase